MINTSDRTTLADLTPLNRVLTVFLLLLIGLLIVDALSVRRAIGREEITQRNLQADIDQTRVLETLYTSLRQKETDLEKSLRPLRPTGDETAGTGTPPSDRIQRLATTHHLACAFVRPMDGDGTGMAVSLSGAYDGLRDFLLELPMVQGLGQLTRLQVLAGRGRLDIMLNLKHTGESSP
jgi:hypothetical protein